MELSQFFGELSGKAALAGSIREPAPPALYATEDYAVFSSAKRQVFQGKAPAPLLKGLASCLRLREACARLPDNLRILALHFEDAPQGFGNGKPVLFRVWTALWLETQAKSHAPRESRLVFRGKTGELSKPIATGA